MAQTDWKLLPVSRQPIISNISTRLAVKATFLAAAGQVGNNREGEAKERHGECAVDGGGRGGRAACLCFSTSDA